MKAEVETKLLTERLDDAWKISLLLKIKTQSQIPYYCDIETHRNIFILCLEQEIIETLSHNNCPISLKTRITISPYEDIEYIYVYITSSTRNKSIKELLEALDIASDILIPKMIDIIETAWKNSRDFLLRFWQLKRITLNLIGD